MPVSRRLPQPVGQAALSPLGTGASTAPGGATAPAESWSLAAGRRVSSRAPRGHRARGGAGPEPQAAGVRGRGLSTERSGFESPL